MLKTRDIKYNSSFLLKIIFLLYFGLNVPAICSQQPDSLHIPYDSLMKFTSDSLKYKLIDSTKAADTTKKKGAVDDIIKYSAKDSAIFDVSDKKLLLYNDGELKYKEYDMKAARITFFKDNKTLESKGIPDTTNSGKYIGTPVFYEGAKKYEAYTIKYNFETKKGNISMGTTQMEGGYYTGEKIKKVSDDIFFVQNGRFTTCDKADPDFYFGSPKMKVIQGDKVIAEPVYLFIDDVPVFAIPFGIFPNHSGRSSGIVTPAYGEDATYGRYLSHLGYFWAINDYTDLELDGNYFTKGRLDLSGRFRYVKRYLYTGELDLGGSRIRIGESGDPDRIFSDEWRIGVTHNQTIDPTTTLSANVNILSSKSYYNNSSNNLNDLLRQNAISDITLSRTWEGTPNSITLNYHRDQNLQSGETNENIPSISFVHSQSYPFRTKNTSTADLKWFETISYDYNAQLLNNRVKSLVLPQGSSSYFDLTTKTGLKQNINFSAPIKISEFNLSPQFSYYEVWYNKYITKTFNPLDSLITTDEHKAFRTMRYFNTGVSLNTRIIGIFNTNFLTIKGFRHTIQPTISYNFQPDFSAPFWKYYATYKDQTGNVVKYSYYEQGIFGAPPRGEQQSISLAVNNIFEMKTRGAKDTVDNKFQLLNVGAGIFYNFAADSVRLSELTLSYRTQVGDLLNIAGGTSFNFYKYVDGVGRINKYLWTAEHRLADLTNFNISLSTTIHSSEEKTNTTADSLKKAKEQYNYEGVGEKADNFSIPWQVTLGYNYSESKPAPHSIFISSNISAGLNFSLTPNWKFSFSSGYDLYNKQLTAPYITINRDLHCWEMNLYWIPVGVYRGYRFELRIKASQLQDVKITKETNYRSVY